MEKYFKDMIVSEILKQPYSGDIFPGYDNINYDFHMLEPIFKNKKTDWKSALENVKGIYSIFDKSNGRKYIGSAYGEFGIWARWSCYIGTGHGWDVKLTKIINSKGLNYAKKNFRFTLLEYMHMKTEDTHIIKREILGKEALLSRGKFGYNKN